ncbi:addiction module component CHP02574 family protein [Taibaiella lutea]|uniref:Addiction module component CHP02574 family protein n=1 Tax=Taibaiella lutea TaxID=2608001 RepID=A0A5M6CIV5_9BACT|nr:addiction module component CHP02574 family protein [Taibaiella lutea]KAA5533325.1 addiction module component CHP02574 family protein [Taibaiella lutea]
MSVQYISDSHGVTTGVFIPINEWNELKDKYKDIEDESSDGVPEWQKEIVLKRIAQYEKDGIMLDFDEAMKDIEKDL